MIAVDTNVLVRVLTRDHPRQARSAAALLRADSVFLAKTVLVEVAWVLARAYGADRATVGRALRGLVGLENAVVEDGETVARALAWHDAGLDFSDALHLAAAGDARAFATFDRRLQRGAKAAAAWPPVVLASEDLPDAVREPAGGRYGARRAAARGRRAARPG